MSRTCGSAPSNDQNPDSYPLIPACVDAARDVFSTMETEIKLYIWLAVDPVAMMLAEMYVFLASIVRIHTEG